MSGPNADGYVPMIGEAVIIIWREGKEFCTLAHDGGSGPIRVYPCDQYDARLDLGRDETLLFCGNEEQARATLVVEGKRAAVQIPVRLAPCFGFEISAMDKEALAILPQYGGKK